MTYGRIMTFSNPGLKAPPTIFRVESNDSDIVRCTGVDGHTHYARLASSFTWQHSERLETCVLLSVDKGIHDWYLSRRRTSFGLSL